MALDRRRRRVYDSRVKSERVLRCGQRLNRSTPS